MVVSSTVRSWLNDLLAALLITAVIGGAFTAHYAASQEAVNLTTNIQAAITFTTSHTNFGNLTPGTHKYATTTLHVETNSSSGWNVTLSGDDVDVTAGRQAMNLDTASTTEITDLDPQWIPGAATTSAGNATTISAGDNVLAFRVMSASGTQQFLADQWWGTDDSPFTNALWAGIASSSASNLKIGETGGPSNGPGSVTHNTVQYYLDVAPSQTTGAYTANLTYTATSN